MDYPGVAMLNLTRPQQQFLCVVLLLLLTGWAVKAWRAAHPAPAPEEGKVQRIQGKPTVGVPAERFRLRIG